MLNVVKQGFEDLETISNQLKHTDYRNFGLRIEKIINVLKSELLNVDKETSI